MLTLSKLVHLSLSIGQKVNYEIIQPGFYPLHENLEDIENYYYDEYYEKIPAEEIILAYVNYPDLIDKLVLALDNFIYDSIDIRETTVSFQLVRAIAKVCHPKKMLVYFDKHALAADLGMGMLSWRDVADMTNENLIIMIGSYIVLKGGVYGTNNMFCSIIKALKGRIENPYKCFYFDTPTIIIEVSIKEPFVLDWDPTYTGKELFEKIMLRVGVKESEFDKPYSEF